MDTAKHIGFWILKIAFALMFLGAAGAKLFGVPQMVAEFNQLGLGQWFRYFTAVVEITGAVLLIWPRTSGFGALLLTGVCIGAFFAQLVVIHQDVIHTILMGGVLAIIAWTQRDQITGRAI